MNRLPAEWERQDAVMMAWPHPDTDWAYMLEEVKLCFHNIAKAIVNNGEMLIIITPNVKETQEELSDLDSSKLHLVEIATNDTWARDMCPIITFDNQTARINDFKFNGWGLKFAADLDNLINTKLFNKYHIFNGEYCNHLNFALEGGSIESDGEGTILTTAECLLSPNRNGGSTKEEIDAYVRNAFGADKVLWLDHGYLAGDDTDSHVDTLARLAPNNTIIYTCTDRKDDEHFEALNKMKEQLKTFTNNKGEQFTLEEVPLPEAIYDEDGLRLPATYANFLIGNGFVLVPIYNQPENDEKALSVFAKVFPNYKIEGIDCNALIKQHGSLHCVTMQIPENSLNLK